MSAQVFFLGGSSSGTSVTPQKLTDTEYSALTTEQRKNLGFTVGKPLAVPSGYAVAFGDDPVLSNGLDSLQVTGYAHSYFRGSQLPLYYDYSIESSGGGVPITGNGDVIGDSFVINDLNLAGLADGTITASLYLTNDLGQGLTVTGTATKGTALAAAPLDGNLNPELVIDNALSFTAEINGTANFAYVGDPAFVTPVLEDDGFVGDYVINYVVPSNSNSISTTTLTVAAPNEEFDYAIVVKRVSGTGTLTFRPRVNGVTIASVVISDTEFAPYSNYPSGAALSDATGGDMILNFLGSTQGDVWQIKASLKRR